MIAGEGLRRSNASGGQNECAGGQASEGHEVAGLSDLDVMDNTLVVIEIDQIKRGVGSRDGKSVKTGNPDSRAGSGSQPLHQNLEDLDWLIDRVNNPDSSGELSLAGLVVGTEYPGVQGPSSTRQNPWKARCAHLLGAVFHCARVIVKQNRVQVDS